jgi:hypothetical protein
MAEDDDQNKRPAQPRQGEEIPISTNFAGNVNGSVSSENWIERVIRESLDGSRITQTTTHVIGAMPPLASQRTSGRRRGRPPAFDQTTITAAQGYLARTLERRPHLRSHWRDNPGRAVNRVAEFLNLDQGQTESKRKSIERHIVNPVLGIPN